MGFFRGFSAPFRAFGFLRREKLLRFIVLPLLVNGLLVVGAVWASAAYWRQELSIHRFGSDALSSLLWVVTSALGAIVIFIVVQPIFGALSSEMLAKRIEKRMTAALATPPPAPFFASTGRSLGNGVLKLVLYALAFLAGLAVSLATAGVGGLVGVVLAAVFFAYDGFDYPLTRRGASFGAKWKYLLLHPMQTIGYGLGITLLYLVPLALVMAPPLMAAGATLVYLEGEKRKKNPKGTKIDETSTLRDR